MSRFDAVEERNGSQRDIVDAFMTVEELALKLRVKPSWVHAHADELGVYRVGKYLRFRWQRVVLILEVE
jgi:hypothetical protein